MSSAFHHRNHLDQLNAYSTCLPQNLSQSRNRQKFRELRRKSHLLVLVQVRPLRRQDQPRNESGRVDLCGARGSFATRWSYEPSTAPSFPAISFALVVNGYQAHNSEREHHVVLTPREYSRDFIFLTNVVMASVLLITTTRRAYRSFPCNCSDLLAIASASAA